MGNSPFRRKKMMKRKHEDKEEDDEDCTDGFTSQKAKLNPEYNSNTSNSTESSNTDKSSSMSVASNFGAFAGTLCVNTQYSESTHDNSSSSSKIVDPLSDEGPVSVAAISIEPIHQPSSSASQNNISQSGNEQKSKGIQPIVTETGDVNKELLAVYHFLLQRLKEMMGVLKNALTGQQLVQVVQLHYKLVEYYIRLGTRGRNMYNFCNRTLLRLNIGVESVKKLESNRAKKQLEVIITNLPNDKLIILREELATFVVNEAASLESIIKKKVIATNKSSRNPSPATSEPSHSTKDHESSISVQSDSPCVVRMGVTLQSSTMIPASQQIARLGIDANENQIPKPSADESFSTLQGSISPSLVSLSSSSSTQPPTSHASLSSNEINLQIIGSEIAVSTLGDPKLASAVSESIGDPAVISTIIPTPATSAKAALTAAADSTPSKLMTSRPAIAKEPAVTPSLDPAQLPAAASSAAAKVTPAKTATTTVSSLVVKSANISPAILPNHPAPLASSTLVKSSSSTPVPLARPAPQSTPVNSVVKLATDSYNARLPASLSSANITPPAKNAVNSTKSTVPASAPVRASPVQPNVALVSRAACMKVPSATVIAPSSLQMSARGAVLAIPQTTAAIIAPSQPNLIPATQQSLPVPARNAPRAKSQIATVIAAARPPAPATAQQSVAVPARGAPPATAQATAATIPPAPTSVHAPAAATPSQQSLAVSARGTPPATAQATVAIVPPAPTSVHAPAAATPGQQSLAVSARGTPPATAQAATAIVPPRSSGTLSVPQQPRPPIGSMEILRPTSSSSIKPVSSNTIGSSAAKPPPSASMQPVTETQAAVATHSKSIPIPAILKISSAAVQEPAAKVGSSFTISIVHDGISVPVPVRQPITTSSASLPVSPTKSSAVPIALTSPLQSSSSSQSESPNRQESSTAKEEPDDEPGKLNEMGLTKQLLAEKYHIPFENSFATDLANADTKLNRLIEAEKTIRVAKRLQKRTHISLVQLLERKHELDSASSILCNSELSKRFAPEELSLIEKKYKKRILDLVSKSD